MSYYRATRRDRFIFVWHGERTIVWTWRRWRFVRVLDMETPDSGLFMEP